MRESKIKVCKGVRDNFVISQTEQAATKSAMLVKYKGAFTFRQVINRDKTSLNI